MTEKLERTYEMEKFTLTPENISEFEVMPDRRQILEGWVKSIHGTLREGKNPVGILTVNLKNGKYRIIDGNHRIEACKRFFSYKVNAKLQIECYLKIYKDLNEDQERETYVDESKRRNESYEDRLNIYKSTITFWKLLKDPLTVFPCEVNIYNAKHSIKFRTLLNAIYTFKTTQDRGYSTVSLHRDSLVPFALDVLYEDYENMRDFIILFKETFGEIESENLFCRSQTFIPLFDIYMRNLSKKDTLNFRERFKKVLGRNELLNLMKGAAGREMQTRIRELLVQYMNIGCSKNEFI